MLQDQKVSSNLLKLTVEMVTECCPRAVARTVLGTVRSPRSRRTGQAISGHVIALLTNIFALALVVAVGTEVKGIAFGLAVKARPAGKTKTLAGVSFTTATVNAGALVGTVRSPVSLGTSKLFASLSGEPRRAGASIGFKTDSVLARFFADWFARFMLGHPISGTAFPMIDESRHVLLFYRLDQFLLVYRTPGIILG